MRRIRLWTHTPAGVWVLFALSLAAVFLVIAFLATFT
jgi:hypothetical protein